MVYVATTMSTVPSWRNGSRFADTDSTKSMSTSSPIATTIIRDLDVEALDVTTGGVLQAEARLVELHADLDRTRVRELGHRGPGSDAESSPRSGFSACSCRHRRHSARGENDNAATTATKALLLYRMGDPLSSWLSVVSAAPGTARMRILRQKLVRPVALARRRTLPGEPLDDRALVHEHHAIAAAVRSPSRGRPRASSSPPRPATS